MKCKYLILLVILMIPFIKTPLSYTEIQGVEDQVLKSLNQDPPPSTDQEIREMLDTLREIHLIKELNLPEDRANRLLEKIRYTRKIRQRYLFQRYQLENTLNALLEYPASDPTKITTVLQELEAAKMQYYQRVIDADNELRMILSPEEQAKYVLFQRNFNKKLKEVIASIRRQYRAKTTPRRNFLLRKQEGESVIRHPR
jgi:Spy/CpxP family protein refolding chaperone